MKEFLEKRFKGKSIGFYIGLAASALMLVFDIIYIAADFGDRTFSVAAFVLILLGVAVEVVYALLDIKILDFLPFIICVLYGVAFGHISMLGLETLSDVWNGVNFIGGNPAMAITFIVLFAVGTIASVTAAFTDKR